MSKIAIVVLVLLGFCGPLLAQQKPDFYKAIADKKFDFLDGSFNIRMESELFSEIQEKYKFFSPRNYQDSLNIALMAEFHDWKLMSSYALKIMYTWNRLAYHLFLEEEECRILGELYGFSWPWDFKMFLINAENHDPYLKKFFKNLEAEVRNFNPTLEIMGPKETQPINEIDTLLSVALQVNPRRIQDHLALFDSIQNIRKERHNNDKEE